MTCSAPIKRPNALHPHHLTAMERRRELCQILALGLVRLHMRNKPEVSDKMGESCLHYPAEEWRHATPPQRRNS